MDVSITCRCMDVKDANYPEEKGKISEQGSKKAVERRPRSKLSKKERSFIILCNILLVTMIIVDLFQVFGFIKLENFIVFILANLVGLSFGYVSYRIKRRVRIRALREQEQGR